MITNSGKLIDVRLPPRSHRALNLLRVIRPLRDDVAHGLTQIAKLLPASWLYDELGSALFDAITLLPEYGLTRADERLLGAPPDIVARAALSPARRRIGQRHRHQNAPHP